MCSSSSPFSLQLPPTPALSCKGSTPPARGSPPGAAASAASSSPAGIPPRHPLAAACSSQGSTARIRGGRRAHIAPVAPRAQSTSAASRVHSISADPRVHSTGVHAWSVSSSVASRVPSSAAALQAHSTAIACRRRPTSAASRSELPKDHSVASGLEPPVQQHRLAQRNGAACARQALLRGKGVQIVNPGLSAAVPKAMAENVTAGPATSEPEGSDVAALTQEALFWCALNGLLVGSAKGELSGSHPGVGMVHAPVTLLPTPFPSGAFHQAYALAPLLNNLVDAVSQDTDFLLSTLSSAAKADSFTASLLQIYAETANERAEKSVRLGMHRSDYMLDTGIPGTGAAEGQRLEGEPQLLQVELNTIASSFPGLSSKVSALHRHLVSKGMLPHGHKNPPIEEWQLPLNPAAQNMAEALAVAWRATRSDPRAVVLMVVQPGERNLYDQQWLAQELWSAHGIRTIRRTLEEVHQQGRLKGGSRELFVDGHPVSVVYYRAGYSPDDYPSTCEWSARLLLERSASVSCPSVAYHLAGAKKVQQRLAEPGCLERFVADESVAHQIRSCFAGLWSLEQTAVATGEGASAPVPGAGRAATASQAMQDALQQPQKFVLKPQREGGGNNIYGEGIRIQLQLLMAEENAEEALAAYILMQRIFPPVHQTLMMRRGEASWVESLSELGIFGTYVRDASGVLLNKAAGHLLRTKTSSSDEGGVAAGFAVLDSPYLV